MGRKGVSKRKPQKPKNQKPFSKGENVDFPGVPRISESSAAKLIGKGEPISVSKGRKKK